MVILGPTACGKSRLGIELARRFDGEIVSADSRQVYRGMDIGTAKATPEERALVPHHLLDVVEPTEEFSLAQYQALAFHAILDIARRGKLPILVGGTGLYGAAVADNYLLPDAPPRPELRRAIEHRSPAELAAMLRELDPDAAARIDLANPRRVMRAIEVALTAPGVERGKKGMPLFRTLRLGITWPREQLYRRIDLRVDQRLALGMVDEARRLLERGVGHGRLESFGLEYRYLSRYLRGDISTLEEMAAQLKLAIHAFARRQLTWFRRDPDIHWLDASAVLESEAAALVTGWPSLVSKP